MTRRPAHRVPPATAPRGRAAEVAEIIRAAGADGVRPVDLAAAIGCQPCNLDAMLATVTPRFPNIAEDDSGRLFWYEWECEA